MSRKHRKTVSIVVALAFLLTLVLPMGAALAAASATLTSSPTPLTEANLDGATLSITLSGDTFVDGVADKANFLLNNKPTGLEIWNVQITGPRTATITLTFDGTDFDADITNFSVTIAAAELTGGSPLTTNDITIKAVREESITVTDDGNVREGQENSGKLIITLNGATFANPLVAPVGISGQPTGVQLETDPSKITRVSDTVIEVPITAAATEDYDADKTATITVPVNDLNGTTQPLTATYTFRATVERIDVSDDGQVVEGSENGEVLTLTLVGDTFKPDVALPGNVIMYGQPAGVGIAGVQYVDPTHVRIVLSGNAIADYDTDLTATIVVKQAGLTWNKGDIMTSYVFRATVEGPPAVIDLDKYRNGFSSSYSYVLTGKNAKGGFAAIRLPEDPNVPRYADKLVVSVTLPSGVQYMAKATGSTLGDYVKVYTRSGLITPALVSSSRSGLEVQVTGVSQPLELAVVFNFDVDNSSALEIASDYKGDIKATVDYVGFEATASGDKTVFSSSQDLLIARVASEEVTVSAASPKTAAVGANREAAKITIAEGTAGTLKSADVKLEILTSGVAFNSATLGKVSGVRYANPIAWFDGSSYKVLRFTMPATQTIGLPGKVEITPYLDLTPDATGDIQIQVTVTSGSKELADVTVTVAKATAAVSYTVSDVKNTGGSIIAGHDYDTLEEGGKAAEFKIKTVGSVTFPADALFYVELSGAKFDKNKPFTVNGDYSGVKTYSDDKAAWFAPPSTKSEIVLSNFNVRADGEAAAGNIVLKFSSNLGNFDPAEVTIGKVIKPFEVSASATPDVTYLGRAQAAGDIVIKEVQKGAIIADLYVRLPEGLVFAAKPSVKVTSGNLKLNTDTTMLVEDNRVLRIGVSTSSSIASTITISGIKYDVNRLAIDGDVTVKVFGYGGPATWDGKKLASVVNAKVVSEAAAPAPTAPTKREASFVIGSTTYKVNGKDYTMDVAPYIDAASGRTYLPVRYVAYALGVSEDNIFYSNGQVSLLKDGRAVQMTIGSKSLVVNGVSITMDAAPVIKDGRTMLPFRWIATALGASVQWDEATKTVTMTIE